jgi:hypothetical protein
MREREAERKRERRRIRIRIRIRRSEGGCGGLGQDKRQETREDRG